MNALSPQLALARNYVQSKDITTIENLLTELTPLGEVLPELIKLLKKALTIPVTSASAERSFSALKRIKTYLRGTMGQSRLNHLAILAIERDIPLNLDAVIDRFDANHPRRIQLK